MKFADTRCRKARMGKVPFSEKQKKLMGQIYVLKAIWLRHKLCNRAGRPYQRKIKRLNKKYKYTEKRAFETIEEIEDALKSASLAHNAFRPKAYEAQQTHREKLAHEIAIESGRDPEKVFKEIMHCTRVKEHFKSIRRKERRGERYGVEKRLKYLKT